MRFFELCFPEWKRKAFTMSYDDGVEQDRRLIEIMKHHGVKGTFNLNGSALEQEEYTYEKGRIARRMGRKAAVATYKNSGMEVAIHAYTHPFLNELPRDLVMQEILKDREMLEGQFGGVIRGMAYPYGTYNDTVVDVLRSCGIVYSRTTVATESFKIPTNWLEMPSTCHHNHPRAIELAEKFTEQKPSSNMPWLFYLWGHAYEFEADNNWDRIEKILNIVGNRDDIWYATNIEIHDYIEAYRALAFDMGGNSVYNPTAFDIYLKSGGKCFIARSGEVTKLI